MESLFVKQIKGGKFIQDGWEFQFSPDKVAEIKKIFSNLLIEENVTAKIKETKEKESKLLDIKCLTDCDIEIPLKTKPYPFQKVGIKFMLEAMTNHQSGILLADDMGLGKSFQSLAVIQILRQEKKISCCLIICPASVKGSWQDEIQTHIGEKPIIIEGNLSKRLELYKEFSKGTSFYLVINYDLLRKDATHISNLLPKKTLIVADETIRIKNPVAKQTKAVKILPSLYRIALTGFPIANTVSDLWSQMDFVKPNWMSRWAFEDKFLVKTLMPFKSPKGREIKIVTGSRNLNLLKEIIEPMHIRRLKSEVLKDLPAKTFEIRTAKMQKEQLKAYIQMRDELRAEILTMDEKTILVNAPTILSRLLRLSQIADGYLSKGVDEKTYWFKKNGKLEVLDELLEEITSSGDSAVIWTRFIPPLKLFLDRYKEKYNAVGFWGETPSEERTKRIKEFQENQNCRVFCGQIQSGGLGITLTKGNVVILYDQCFLSAATINQGLDRCHRIGQLKKVVVISLLVEDSIDQHWQKIWMKKEKIAGEIFKGDKITFREKEDILEFLK